MRLRQLACLVISMAAIICVGRARGEILAQYSFTDVNAGQLNREATTVASNVTAGTITDAPIVFTHPMVELIRSTGVGYATEPVLSAQREPWNESLFPENVYFTFGLSANSGHILDLNSLTFNVARGGAATPRTYDIRTSLDGFATSLTGGAVEISTQRPTFTPVSIDLSGATFQNISSPLTFQFRFFSPDFNQNVDFDDITVNGTVAAALPGDYNGDGKVDAADYVLWRKNNINGSQGYTDWRANFGNSLPGNGSGSLASLSGVPEPAAYLLVAILIAIVGLTRRR
jgi:hypothetical protein